MDAKEPIESTEPNDMIDPRERALPTEPMESTLPTDPMDSKEPFDPMLSTDELDAIDRREERGTAARLQGPFMPGSALGAILRA
jgi:hypothetical protein